MHARSGTSQLRVRVEAVAGAELRRWLFGPRGKVGVSLDACGEVCRGGATGAGGLPRGRQPCCPTRSSTSDRRPSRRPPQRRDRQGRRTSCGSLPGCRTTDPCCGCRRCCAPRPPGRRTRSGCPSSLPSARWAGWSRGRRTHRSRCRRLAQTNARRSLRVRSRRERGSTKGWVHTGAGARGLGARGAGRGRRTVAIAVDHRRELDTYRGAREYLAVLIAHQRGRVPRRSIPSCFEAASVASASAKRPSRVAEHQARRLKVPAVAAALAGVGEHRHLLRSAEKGGEGGISTHRVEGQKHPKGACDGRREGGKVEVRVGGGGRGACSAASASLAASPSLTSKTVKRTRLMT